MSTASRPVFEDAEVVATSLVADDIRRLVLRRRGVGRAAPGTHVDVRLPIGGTTDVRSYSVVESSDDGSLLTLSVRLSPTSRGGSAAMHRLVVGDRLACSQPLQNFELRLGADRYVLLAGGIGITALMEMGRVLARLGQDYRVVVVGREASAMAYVEELRALHGDRLTVHRDDEDGVFDVEGLIASLPQEGRTEAYVCGPIRLMDAARRAWLAGGRALTDLRVETFGSSGWFDPEEFVVEVPALGLSATVPPGASLLQALVAAGADVMYDCRKGECGLCELHVEGLEGRIDHRDVFLSDGQKQADATLCACVSRVAAGPGGAPGSGRVVLSL